MRSSLKIFLIAGSLFALVGFFVCDYLFCDHGKFRRSDETRSRGRMVDTTHVWYFRFHVSHYQNAA